MNAFVCGTSVHVLRTIHMCTAIPEYAGTTNVYICDTFSNAGKIAENLRNTGYFNQVYYIECFGSRRLRTLWLLFRVRKGLFWHKKKHRYDRLIGFTPGSEVIDALYWLSKRNPDVEYDCVEDGPGIYPLHAPKEYKCYKGRALFALFGLERAYSHMTKWWFSQPEYMHPEARMEDKKVQLPPMDPYDGQFMKIVNTVFDYVPDENLYHADLLIMEESMYTDHIMIENADYVLYEKVRKRYADKNILVKLHPRTRDNRFAEKFHTMRSTGIPWEVYLLNQVHEGYKIPLMLGIACVTMSSDKFLLDMETKKIILLPMFDDRIRKRENGDPMFGSKIIEEFIQLKHLYREPDKIAIIKSEEELFETLDSYFGR